ncbi:uncharacterized protein LOC105381709 [Plutella xylostella]|uniref:uncharacterized protein LOC105381709 n=1 Tax=Plutella xylostella TaxID=51655 RepID=UPI002032D991|nr:uncharacterized protein LOC105381709 [Plutella xylostella]
MESKKDKEEIVILENKLEDMQKSQRKTSIEIKNVPLKGEETKKDLLEMIVKLSENINLKLVKPEVKDIIKIKKKENTKSTIIVEFTNTFIRTDILKCAKNYNIKNKTNKLSAKHLGLQYNPDVPIYISENLTPKVLLVHDNKSLKAWDTIQPVSVERTGSDFSWFQQFEIVEPKQADYVVIAFDPRDQELFYELEGYPGLLGCEKLLYRTPVASWENYMKPEYFRVPCISFCNFDEFNVKDYNITDEYDLQCRLNIWVEGALVVSKSSPHLLLGVTTWGPGLFTLKPNERYVVGLAVPNSPAYRAAMACADAILSGKALNDAVCDDF